MTQGVVLARGVVAVDGDTGGTTPGTLYAYGLYAAMPAASAFTGQYYFATDIGVNGIMVYSNGTTRTAAWPQVLARSAVAVSGAADTNENTLATITVPAGLMGLNGQVRVWATWTLTNNANGKTTRAKFGGTSFYTGTVASLATVPLVGQIANRNSAAIQVGGGPPGSSGIVTATTAVITAAIDTSVAVDITLTAQKTTAGDTMTLERYLVEILP